MLRYAAALESSTAVLHAEPPNVASRVVCFSPFPTTEMMGEKVSKGGTVKIVVLTEETSLNKKKNGGKGKKEDPMEETGRKKV